MDPLHTFGRSCVMLGPGDHGEIVAGQVVLGDQLCDPGQARDRVQRAQLDIQGQDFRELVRPVLEELLLQVAPIPEVPVEAALRDSEVPGQSLDPDADDALVLQDSQGGLEPLGLAGPLPGALAHSASLFIGSRSLVSIPR